MILSEESRNVIIVWTCLSSNNGGISSALPAQSPGFNSSRQVTDRYCVFGSLELINWPSKDKALKPFEINRCLRIEIGIREIVRKHSKTKAGI